eukprot:2670834-Prorocentrum_lima.AAC.1
MEGVLGITRTMRTSSPRCAWNTEIGTPPATEMTHLSFVTCGAMSRSTTGTTSGFTAITMVSDCLATSALPSWKTFASGISLCSISFDSFETMDTRS